MKILVKRRAALGDVLNTTPVVRRLRHENPGAVIHVATFHAHAYWNNPDVDGVVHPEIDATGYDRTIDLNGAYEKDRRRHQVDAMMAAAFGDAEGDKSVFLAHPDRFFPKADWSNVVVLHPSVSVGWASRIIPQSWWQRVADTLVSWGSRVVVTGTMVDTELHGPGIEDYRGRLTLADQAALIEVSRCALCGPSGISTLVGATETPLVVLCNITRAEFGALPYRHDELGWNTIAVRTPLSCYGCSEDEPPSEFYACRRGDNACVRSFDLEEVCQAVVTAMAEDRRYVR